jgi:uncharacterized protein YodC (DUF2158 family)
MDLKVGDVVRLKTGGPNMTVQRIYEVSERRKEAEVETVWFDQIAMKDGTTAWGDMHCADWVPELLEKVDP